MSMLFLLIWICFYHSRLLILCFCTILSKLLLFQSLSTCSRIPPSHESLALSRGISRALLHSQSCSLALACSRRAPAKVAHFFSLLVFHLPAGGDALTSPASVSQPKCSACDLCFYNRIVARQFCFAASFAHHLFPCTQLFGRVFCFHHAPHLPTVSSQFVPRACITVQLNRSRSNCAAVRNGPALLYVLLIARGPHYS